MANVLFGYDNVADSPWNIVVTGWWDGNPTVAALKTRSLTQRYISAGLAADQTRWQCSFPGTTAAPAISLVALCSHSLSLAAQIRVSASNVSDFSASVYSSGWVAAFDPAVTEATRTGMRWNSIVRLGAAVAATYWRFEVSDASNPDGRVTIGRLFAGTEWQPTVNMAVGAGLGWDSNLDVQQAINGAEWITEREAARSAKFRIRYLPGDEAFDRAFDLLRAAAGVRREVLFCADPAAGKHLTRKTFLGAMRKLSAIEEPYVNGHEAAFEIRELL